MQNYTEIFSHTEARLVYCKDHQSIQDTTIVSLGSFTDVADDIETYYIVLNTWFGIIQDAAASFSFDFKGVVMRNGLIPIIKQFSEDSDILTGAGDGNLSSPAIALISEVGPEREQLILEILRYPKRLTLNYAPDLKEESLKAFIANENLVKLSSRRELRSPIDSRIKELLAGALQPAKRALTSAKAVGAAPHCDLRFFSDGVAYKAATKLSKIRSVLNNAPGVFPFEYFTYGNPGFIFRYGKYREPVNTAYVTAVPKSYKACRIIAVEEAHRQYLMSGIYRVVSDTITRPHRAQTRANLMKPSAVSDDLSEIPLFDQWVNQELARIGSIDGSYATLDMSNASDLISKVFFRSYFPDWFVKVVDPLLPTHYVIDGDTRLMHQCATAGCQLTFVIESLTYWAISRAACEYAATVVGDTAPFSISVYGDDIIIPTKYAETCIDFLVHYRLKVNTTKSFYSPDHLYRESCGAEYYKGLHLDSRYFPRKALHFCWKTRGDGVKTMRAITGPETSESLESIVSLQKRVFGVSRTAARFLASYVRDFYPSFTSSDPGSTCSDLWETFPVSKQVLAPVQPGTYEVSTAPWYALRELHWSPENTFHDDGKGHKLLDEYYYYLYLKEGPMYMDPLMRLLGVTSSRVDYSRDNSQPEHTWRRLRQ